MDPRDEIRALSEALRAHLRWADEIASGALPASPSMHPATSPARVMETRELDVQKVVEPSPTPPRGIPEPAPPEPAPAERRAPSRAEDPKRDRLRLIAREAAQCTLCRLHEGRTRSVFSRGSEEAIIAFVGEGPGFHEDQQGLPFVGPAGELLDKMIGAMKLKKDEVYIANVVKCRPPNNRTPKPDEAGACLSYLERQLDIVMPKVIVALGRCASESLAQVSPGGRGWRGKWGEFRGIPTLSTYHPAYLLRSPEQKKPVWQDLRSVMAHLARR